MAKDEAANAYGSGGGSNPGDPGSGGRWVTIGGWELRLITIVLAVLALVLVVAAVAAYAYDSSRKEKIADGVKIGHVDVGGLDRQQAARRVQRRLVAPLHRPVKVKLGSETYKLPADKLKIRADLDGMVDEAISDSQSWGVPARVFRYVTGDPVNDTVQPKVSYSHAAVRDFVQSVGKQVDRDPQDASVSPSGASLNVVPAQNGRTLKQGKLISSVETAIDKGGRNKLVNAHVVVKKPQVSTSEVASKYPVYLTLDRAAFTLRLWQHLKLTKSYSVAVGQTGLETPAGLYHIEDKQVNPSWHVPNSSWAGSLAGQTIPPGPADPIKARWLGIFAGAGIHGTDETWSIGQAISHGCVRMSIPDVIELYPKVPVGTPIYIQ
jgi:L,D-transpeptidase catalytic domain/Putative peptidoglycan binding domain